MFVGKVCKIKFSEVTVVFIMIVGMQNISKAQFYRQEIEFFLKPKMREKKGEW